MLTLYDIEAKTKVCADASSHGLKAVLLQQQNSWWPVAFASQALSETETLCTDREGSLGIDMGCGEIFRIHSGEMHYTGN